MYVTGSDAWNFQKQMWRGRIEAKSPSEEGQGLPDAVRRGNRMRGRFWPPEPAPGPEKPSEKPAFRRQWRKTIVYSPGAPILSP